jgi:hypothetical protein
VSLQTAATICTVLASHLTIWSVVLTLPSFFNRLWLSNTSTIRWPRIPVTKFDVYLHKQTVL